MKKVSVLFVVFIFLLGAFDAEGLNLWTSDKDKVQMIRGYYSISESDVADKDLSIILNKKLDGITVYDYLKNVADSIEMGANFRNRTPTTKPDAKVEYKVASMWTKLGIKVLATLYEPLIGLSVSTMFLMLDLETLKVAIEKIEESIKYTIVNTYIVSMYEQKGDEDRAWAEIKDIYQYGVYGTPLRNDENKDDENKVRLLNYCKFMYVNVTMYDNQDRIKRELKDFILQQTKPPVQPTPPAVTPPTRTLKPQVSMQPSSGTVGTTFTETGKGFSPSGTATIHGRRPDGSEWQIATVQTDSSGSYSRKWIAHTPGDNFALWAVDNAAGNKSNEIVYNVAPKEAAPSSQYIFVDDYTDPKPKFKVSGLVNYRISNGLLELTDGWHYVYYDVDIRTQNYTIEMKVKSATGDGYGVFWKADASPFSVTSNGFQYQAIWDKIIMMKYPETESWWHEVPFPTTREWKIVKIVIEGNTVSLYLDGRLIHRFTDLISTGKAFGLRSWRGVTYVDYVKVYGTAYPSSGVQQGRPVAVIKCEEDLYSMGIDGNKAKITSSGDIGERSDWALSPDKTKVAFEKQGDIYVIDVARKAKTRITSNPSKDSLPFWSPDSKKLGFISERRGVKVKYVEGGYSAESYRQDIYMTDVLDKTEANIRLVYQNDLRLEKGAESIAIMRPSWSPDGGEIAFLAVYVLSRGGSQEASLLVYSLNDKAGKKLTELYTWGSNLSWAPDSRRIAHESRIVDANTGSVQKIGALDDFGTLGTAWSPDGKWIAYSTTQEIYIVDPNSGQITQLTFHPVDDMGKAEIMDNFPLWASNSKQIIFERWHPTYFEKPMDDIMKDKNAEICIIEIETKKVTVLTEKGCSLTDYMWSQS